MGSSIWEAVFRPVGDHPSLPVPQGSARKAGPDAYHHLGVVDLVGLDLNPYVGENKPVCFKRRSCARGLRVEL